MWDLKKNKGKATSEENNSVIAAGYKIKKYIFSLIFINSLIIFKKFFLCHQVSWF